MLPFLWNVHKSYRYGEVVTVDDPWGYGNSLEWATSCPPPRHNFTSLPGSVPSARPSNCTTRTCRNVSTGKPTRYSDGNQPPPSDPMTPNVIRKLGRLPVQPECFGATPDQHAGPTSPPVTLPVTTLG